MLYVIANRITCLYIQFVYENTVAKNCFNGYPLLYILKSFTTANCACVQT